MRILILAAMLAGCSNTDPDWPPLAGKWRQKVAEGDQCEKLPYRHGACEKENGIILTWVNKSDMEARIKCYAKVNAKWGRL